MEDYDEPCGVSIYIHRDCNIKKFRKCLEDVMGWSPSGFEERDSGEYIEFYMYEFGYIPDEILEIAEKGFRLYGDMDQYCNNNAIRFAVIDGEIHFIQLDLGHKPIVHLDNEGKFNQQELAEAMRYFETMKKLGVKE